MTREQDLILRLCQVVRAANSLIDQGERLHILETRRRIYDGDLFSWLSNRHQHIASHLWAIGSLHQLEILELFEDLASIRAEQKYGVTREGLSLLIAYSTEAIQMLSAP